MVAHTVSHLPSSHLQTGKMREVLRSQPATHRFLLFGVDYLLQNRTHPIFVAAHLYRHHDLCLSPVFLHQLAVKSREGEAERAETCGLSQNPQIKRDLIVGSKEIVRTPSDFLIGEVPSLPPTPFLLRSHHHPSHLLLFALEPRGKQEQHWRISCCYHYLSSPTDGVLLLCLC